MRHEIPRKRVGVVGVPPGGPDGLLFGALAQLYPVEFVGREADGLDALVLLNGDVSGGMHAAAAGVPSFVAMPRTGASERAAGQVRFGASASLDSALRNQEMIHRQDSCLSPVTVQPEDEILASLQDRPIWLSRPAGRSACQLAGILPPRLQEGEFLFQYLNGHRFIELLPLVHFIRHLVREIDWVGPAPRACLVFDDPSFYWRSYGFVNFRRLAEHATRHKYFAAIATIPLDTWWVNKGVAALLRVSRPRLSILIHGNNHLNREMLLRDRREGLATAAQALRRMERLMQRHGLEFARIMEAPHAVLSNNMLQQLKVAGFEAALCTTELFVRHNQEPGLPPTFGLDRSAMLGGGLPTMPRIKMTPDWKNDVLLAAFLRQPIIIAGHHYDAAHGMKIMAEMAETINRLDGVTWSDLPGILRTNYLQRVAGDVLIVKMYSRCITVTIPAGIRQLCVQRHWLAEGQTERLTVASGASPKIERAAGSAVEWLRISDNLAVEISTENEVAPVLSGISPPQFSPWVVLRKILMEIRDRVTPFLPIVDRLHRGSPAK